MHRFDRLLRLFFLALTQRQFSGEYGPLLSMRSICMPGKYDGYISA